MTGPRVLLLAVMSNWMFQNLVPSLRRLCAHVYAYPFGNTMSNWDQPSWLSLRARLADRLRSDARAIAADGGIDAVIMLQYDESIGPGATAFIRAPSRANAIALRRIQYASARFPAMYSRPLFCCSVTAIAWASSPDSSASISGASCGAMAAELEHSSTMDPFFCAIVPRSPSTTSTAPK